jgi:lipopolysaccharide transport system permease protein
MNFAAGFDGRDGRLGVNFAKMMLRDRFLGTGLGMVWAVLQPALLIGVMVVVFTFIFRSRLPGQNSDLAFVIWIVSGYGPWLAINEAIMAGAGAVTSQSALVKNMAFKTELLPIAATVIGLVPLLVTFIILVPLILLDGRVPNVSWTIIPLVLLIQSVFVAGLGLMLGAINVYVRDLTLALPSILTMLLFLSPIFYPISTYPEALRPIVSLNPFYAIANGFRDPIVNGVFPPMWQVGYTAILAVITFFAGLMIFRRLKTYFHSRL